MNKEKEIHKYVLAIDFEGGDGPDYIPLEDNEESLVRVREVFPSLLHASWPPPHIEVIGLTKAEWEAAELAGKERA